ncbi:hypothetical protein pb186bvf_016316 [Paramecium bursaria]
MKQLIRSLSFFQQPHFQFASFTEKMQKSQEQKAKDQFKKEIDYLLNKVQIEYMLKPEFTMIDFRQRAVDGLAQIKKGFIKKLMVGASQEEQEKKLEIQKKIMNAMFDNELLEIDNITSEQKKQVAMVSQFTVQDVNQVIKEYENFQGIHQWLRGLKSRGEPIPQSQEELLQGYRKDKPYKKVIKLKNIIVIFKIRNQERLQRLKWGARKKL